MVMTNRFVADRLSKRLSIRFVSLDRRCTSLSDRLYSTVDRYVLIDSVRGCMFVSMTCYVVQYAVLYTEYMLTNKQPC